MGFRFRKSMNLGGGFRVNMSKSGIGYSYGMKGFRVTHTARGTTRTTSSIPGTGLSYVDESGTRQNKEHSRSGETQFVPVNEPQVNEITSAPAEQINAAGEGDIARAIERAMLINRISNWLFVLWIFIPPLLFAAIALKIYVCTKGKVEIEYDFDEQQKEMYQNHVQAWMALAGSRKIWQVITEQSNDNIKKHAGAGRTVSRVPCMIMNGLPKFVRTNVCVIEIQLHKKEKMYIFPDKVFLIRGKEVAAASNKEIKISATSVNFVERDPVPEDAQIVGYTWEYVNKDGAPDARFKDNRQFPKCLYGDIAITSVSGLNVELQVSNAENAKKFLELYK